MSTTRALKMSRSRKVAPEEAVQAAMEAFWKHGYHELGTRQLEEETGITRFTLQTSYGGKKKLFLAALDHYLDTLENQGLPPTDDSSLEKLALWFETRPQPILMPSVARYGCLMLNSTVEFMQEDEEVNQRAERFFTFVRGSFETSLQNIKDAGKLPNDFDIQAKAELLLGSSIGLNIIIRSATHNAAGFALAASVSSMIRSWGQ